MAQQTVPIPCGDCGGQKGRVVSTTRQATDNKGNPVTVFGERWESCQGCSGTGMTGLQNGSL